MNSIFQYQAGSSILHRMHPIAKLIVAFLLVLSACISTNLLYMGTLLFACLVFLHACGILSAQKPILSAVGILACVMICIQCLIRRTGDVLVWFVTIQGLQTGVAAGLRLFIFALPWVSILSSTKLSDLANCLVSYMHIPYPYVFSFTTALRFIPLFAQEMHAIQEVNMARGIDFDTKNPIRKLKLMTPLVISLMVLSVRKADEIALAAEMRGCYLRGSTSFSKRYPWNIRDSFGVLMGISLVIVSIVL